MKDLQAIPFNFVLRFVVDNLSNTGRTKKQLVSFAIDACVVAFSIWAAYSLRLGEAYTDFANIWLLLLILPPVTVFIFAIFGVYRWVVRASNTREFEQLFKGTVLSAASLLIMLHFLPNVFAPRSVFAIYAAQVLIFTILFRVIWAKLHSREVEQQGKPVVVYGAGAAGRQLVALFNLGSEYHPEFYLDDSRSLIGSTITGLTVYNPKNREQLQVLFKKHAIAELILAVPSLQGTQYRALLQNIKEFNIPVKTVPSVSEIVSGNKSADDVRPLKLDDLLGRRPVAPDPKLLSKYVTNKIVLVTGAGGSIGSELARQIVRLDPKSLILLDNSEISLYQIDQSIRQISLEYNLQTPVLTKLGSITDIKRLEELFEKYKPNTVYHAAAYKHVPLVEENPLEGLKNNLFGTRNVVEVSERYGVDNFVFISTDKAVRPTNIMGASKRLCEILINTHAEKLNQKTKFCMVRFGNVLGSSGSVIPRFDKQIKSGGPVTVTDRAMTRYFMTIPEAVSLVIQAGAMSKGGEVFLLDMGEPVKIVDLAIAMIRLRGKQPVVAWEHGQSKTPDHKIEIIESGIRPGEKLVEELLITIDTAKTTGHPKIFEANESCNLSANKLNEWLYELQSAIDSKNEQILTRLLLAYNVGYAQNVTSDSALIPMKDTSN